MAAVLCSLPCKLCSESCRMFGTTCSCMCGCVKSIARSCRSPFCFFGTVATVLNLPAIASAISILPTILSYGIPIGACQGLIWLFVDAALCLVNIAAAWYFASVVVSRRRDPTSELPSRAFERATYLICYDPFIAVYLVVVTGFAVWQGIGSAWFTIEMAGGSGGYCPDGLAKVWSTAIAFGWAYLFAGTIALCMGFCCASCDRNEYGGRRSREFYVTPEQQRNGHVPSIMTDPQVRDEEMGKKAGKSSSLFQSNKNNIQGGDRAQAEIPMAEAIVIGTANPPATAPVASPTKAEAKGQGAESGVTDNSVIGKVTKTVMNQIEKMKKAQVD